MKAVILLLCLASAYAQASTALEQSKDRRLVQQGVVDRLQKDHAQQQAQCKKQWNASWCRENLLPTQRAEMRDARRSLSVAKQHERDEKSYTANEQFANRAQQRQERDLKQAELRAEKGPRQVSRSKLSARRSPEQITASVTKYQRKIERHQQRLARLEAKQRQPKAKSKGA